MKAILVVDMPVSCTQCRFRDVDGCSVDDCAKSNDGSLVIDRYIYDLKRHGSCPLKPMPEKLDNPYDEEQGGYLWKESFVVGYNECLDEILGEKNE